MSHANLFRLLFVILFLAGAWMVYFGVNEIRLGRESVTWPAVQGVVNEVYWKSGSRGKGGSWRVRYSYEFEGRNYKNDRRGFGLHSKEGLRPKKGQDVSVYVNPVLPEESTLQTGFGSGVWFPIVLGGLFVTFSTVLTFLMPWSTLDDLKYTRVI